MLAECAKLYHNLLIKCGRSCRQIFVKLSLTSLTKLIVKFGKCDKHLVNCIWQKFEQHLAVHLTIAMPGFLVYSPVFPVQDSGRKPAMLEEIGPVQSEPENSPRSPSSVQATHVRGVLPTVRLVSASLCSQVRDDAASSKARAAEACITRRNI